jgi:hypothetical protein
MHLGPVLYPSFEDAPRHGHECTELTLIVFGILIADSAPQRTFTSESYFWRLRHGQS